MTDLFTHADRYPVSPARGKTDTSASAAESIAPSANTLRQKTLEIIESRGRWGATADEVAAEMRIDKLAIRPRVTELKRMGLIKDSGVRRKNESGRAAAVMVAM